MAEADDALLAEEGLPKGSMTLIDAERAEALRGRMGLAVEVSGGSAANTMVGVARLGGAAGYIGKVRDDAVGAVFRHDIQEAGVAFPTPAAADGAATARCLIFVTPDAQRTMNTHPRRLRRTRPRDIDPDFIASARLLYMEGYLWDPACGQGGLPQGARDRPRGRRAGLPLALGQLLRGPPPGGAPRSGGEPHRRAVRERGRSDGALRSAGLRHGPRRRPRGLRHRGPHPQRPGLRGRRRGAVHTIEAAPIGRLVDTTGAGDLYAAGFLLGLARGFDLARCGRLASLTAGEILGHYGARPEADIAPFVRREPASL